MSVASRTSRHWLRRLVALRGRSFREAVRLVWRKLVYRRVVLGRYGVIAGHSVQPPGEAPVEISFLHAPDFGSVEGTSPYLKPEDVERFRGLDTVCIVARDGEVVAATSWMSRGEVFVTELQRTVPLLTGEHFSSRSFVAPAYRGRGLLSHMIHAYSTRIAESQDRVWGLVYDWNLASIRSLEKVGWTRCGELGTITVLGVQIPIERRETYAGGPRAAERSNGS